MYNCPWCLHPKPKLSVNLETDTYNCWTCEGGVTRGRSLTGLLRNRVEDEFLREYMDSLIGWTKPVIERDDTPPLLPTEFESMSWDYSRDPTARQYISYMTRRGATHDDLVFYRMGMCRTGELRGRVIFPSFDLEGHLNFYTARKIDDKAWGQPYITPDTTKDIVFNDSLIDWNYPVVLVEGPFDMLTVKRNAIPLQGKFLRPSSRLFERIVLSKTPVYLALDSDAKADQIAMAHMLYRYGVTVYNVELGQHKDVSEMGRERFSNHLLDATMYRDTDRIRLLCA